MSLAVLAAAGLTMIASLRIASTYRVFSHTIDEAEHLAAGMQWLDKHQYTYEDQHPPLARVVGALVPYMAGERSHNDPSMSFDGFKILGWDSHYDRVLALGRSGILVLFWIGTAVVFLWANRVGGPMAALFATAFFTTAPPILAHSGLITTDMGLTALTAATAAASLWWADRPDWLRTLGFGALLGGAVLSKFSALAFLPAAWLAMYCWHVNCDRPGWRGLANEIRRRLAPGCAALFVGALVVWAGYRFEIGPVGEFGGIRLPAPHLFSGIHAVWIHNREGHGAYLLGQISHFGFWYYYPVILSVKTPLAMLILAIATAWLAIRRRRRELGMPLAFAAGIVLFSMTTHINIGVRHVLPVYAAFAVLCGAGAQMATSHRHAAGIAAGLLLGWQIVAGAWIHPDYIAYTNELAGRHPENVLADSDLDWGQDMNRLHDFFRSVGADSASILTLNNGYGAYLGHDLPKIIKTKNNQPVPGWNAVSMSWLKLNRGPEWAGKTPALRRIGRSIDVWYFPPATSKPTAQPGVHIFDDGEMQLGGPWAHMNDFGNAYQGTLSYSDTLGASAEFGFEGKAVTYVFTRAFNRGVAAISIDGVVQPDIDLFSPEIQCQQRERFELTKAGHHTIRIRVTGRKHPQSKGTFIDLDAVIVE